MNGDTKDWMLAIEAAEHAFGSGPALMAFIGGLMGGPRPTQPDEQVEAYEIGSIVREMQRGEPVTVTA